MTPNGISQTEANKFFTTTLKPARYKSYWKGFATNLVELAKLVKHDNIILTQLSTTKKHQVIRKTMVIQLKLITPWMKLKSWKIICSLQHPS